MSFGFARLAALQACRSIRPLAHFSPNPSSFFLSTPSHLNIAGNHFRSSISTQFDASYVTRWSTKPFLSLTSSSSPRPLIEHSTKSLASNGSKRAITSFSPLQLRNIRHISVQQRPQAKRSSLLKYFGILSAIGIASSVATAFMLPNSHIIVPKPEFITPESEKLLSDNTALLWSCLPTKLGSMIWGYVTHLELPVQLREPLYGFYSTLFNVIMEEVPKPLKEFPSLNSFFTRRIHPSVRPISHTEFVSPVDGSVLVFGDCDGLWSEQVKGIWYSLESLLGQDVHELIQKYRKPQKGKSKTLPNLKYCVIYLAPGDYHGIHAPVKWDIQDVRHFTGHLFSVSPQTSAKLHGLLAVNERVCLNGTSPYGFFSMTPVGAYNVGSITLEFDPKFDTNNWDQTTPGVRYDLQLPNNKKVAAEKGECVSFFNLGSTVVLIFEAPADFEWKVKEHQKIQLGQPLFGSK